MKLNWETIIKLKLRQPEKEGKTENTNEIFKTN